MLSKLSIGQTSGQTGGQLVEVNRVNLSINRLWDVPIPLEETQHRLFSSPLDLPWSEICK